MHIAVQGMDIGFSRDGASEIVAVQYVGRGKCKVVLENENRCKLLGGVHLVFKGGTSVFSSLVTLVVLVGRFSVDAPWHIEFNKTCESQEQCHKMCLEDHAVP